MNNIKTITAFIFAMTFITFSLHAQTEQTYTQAFDSLSNKKITAYPKHEIGMSCGLFSAPILIPLPYLPCVIPNFNLDYHYNFNVKHSIGVSYSISTDFPFPLSKWINKSYIDEYPDTKNLFTSSIFNSLQIGYRINFLKAGKFTFYSSFFAGVNLVCYDIKNKEKLDLLILPSLHVTPLGFAYGQQNTLNFEVGIGTRGLLIIGYHYHFNK